MRRRRDQAALLGAPGERVVVLSPHLDDAVFSLGAAIAHSTALGNDVRVVTVFANDASTAAPASAWDAACGFTSAAEAARARSEEDDRACAIVGATPVRLAFADEDHGGTRAAAPVVAALESEFAQADVLLLPGFPLLHPDHRWLADVVLGHAGADGARVGFYVEQPYASWHLIGRGRRSWALPGLDLRRGLLNAAAILLRTKAARRLQAPDPAPALAGAPGIDWRAAQTPARHRLRKQRAVQAYRSQLRGFGPLVGTRMALYELGWGGEGLGWRRPGP